jgi:hypothetical protein
VIDPEASMRANLCQPLSNLGLTEAARAQGLAALARAQAIGQPMALMLARWCCCMLEIRSGEIERVRPHAQALAECVDRHAVAQGDGPSRWYRGWVLAHDGDPNCQRPNGRTSGHCAPCWQRCLPGSTKLCAQWPRQHWPRSDPVPSVAVRRTRSPRPDASQTEA